jgi:hypothetical protein
MAKTTVRQGKRKQKSGANPGLSEVPVDAEIRRAAERIGYDPGAQWLRQVATLRLAAVQATDHLSEAAAVIEEDIETSSVLECINRALLQLWQIRWALGVVGGSISKVES